jgi:hypothetical protein
MALRKQTLDIDFRGGALGFISIASRWRRAEAHFNALFE